MGLFNRKSMQERQEDAMKMAENIGQGKGLYGRMTKAFIGSENAESIQSMTASMRQTQDAAQLQAAGVPTESVTVLAVQDTGQSVNGNPNVVLTVQIQEQPVTLLTLVSRLEIPRAGEQVLVLRDPQSGSLLYAGLAPRV